ncbi:MAG: NAD(P)H-dependent oxidoreductase [Candidatus Saccharimonas aalborgensis]|jgi:putative NADPH-quinone reductase
MKKILIINGHPNLGTLCSSLANHYAEGARSSGAEVRTINIRDLPLEKYLRFAYYERTPVGKEIQHVRDEITWAEHIVFIYPTTAQGQQREHSLKNRPCGRPFGFFL